MNIDINKPTNIKLVKLTDGFKNRLGVVTTGQIFDNNNDFHPEGLFSNEIFGAPGSEERKDTFGRIDLNLKVLHPSIYSYIIELRSLYERIMEGSEFVVFDEDLQDFVVSTDRGAGTGFYFFLKHLKKIKFDPKTSADRKHKIMAIEKAIATDTYLVDSYIVIPAGFRDYIIGRNGRPEEDEINTLYRKIIARSSLIDPQRSSREQEMYSDAAIGIQKAVVDVYLYISELLKGKNKLLQSKWVSRKVFNSSANVAASYVDDTVGYNDAKRMDYDDSRVGLHQYVSSSKPISQSRVLNKYAADIFPPGTDVVQLTNVETLKLEDVLVSGIQKDVDLWTTTDGIEKVFSFLANPDIREEPILFKHPGDRKKTFCIGLLYRDDKCFKFFRDISELPEGFSKDKVSPINLFEFIYASMYTMSGEFYGLVTRYPITGEGSIYPSRIVCVTTNESDTLYELDDDWQLNKETPPAIFFPRRGSSHINTFTVHVSHLGALGGDYDGDMFHLKMLLANESTAEIKELLNSKSYYINDAGKVRYSCSNDVINSVLRFMS